MREEGRRLQKKRQQSQPGLAVKVDKTLTTFPKQLVNSWSKSPECL